MGNARCAGGSWACQAQCRDLVGGMLLGQPSSKARALRFLPPVRLNLGLRLSPPHPVLVSGTRPWPSCESSMPCLSTCPAGWGQPSPGPTPHLDWRCSPRSAAHHPCPSELPWEPGSFPKKALQGGLSVPRTPSRRSTTGRAPSLRRPWCPHGGPGHSSTGWSGPRCCSTPSSASSAT